MKTAGSSDSEHELKLTITSLEARLADLQARLPAHSIPPALIAEMDEIEGLLEAAKARLAIQPQVKDRTSQSQPGEG